MSDGRETMRARAPSRVHEDPGRRDLPKLSTVLNPSSPPAPHLFSLAGLLKSFRDCLLVCSPDGSIQYFWSSNPRCPKESSLLGKRLLEVFDPETFDQLAKSFQSVLQSGKCQEHELPVLLDDGLDDSEHIFTVRVAPVHSAIGNAPAFSLVTKDVTFRVKMFEELKAKTDLLEQAEQLVGLGSWEFDHDKDSFHWSAQFYRMLGMDSDSGPLPIDQAALMVHPEDREKANKHRDDLVSRGVPLENELRFVLPSGDVRLFHSRALAVIDKNGRTRIRGMSQDITEQVASQRRLARQEAMMEAAEQLAKIGAWECDPDAKEFSWSPSLWKLMNMEPRTDPMSFEEAHSFFHPDDLAKALSDFHELVSRGIPLDNELRLVRPGGSIGWFRSRAVPITDDTGALLRIAGMSQDVTAQREAELKLKRSEDLLRHGEEIASFGTWEYDLKTNKPTLLSTNFLEMCGVASEAQWTLELCWERVHPDDRKIHKELMQGSLREAKPFQFVSRYRKPDGNTRTHLTRAVPIAGPDGAPARMIGVVQDITEQTHSEQELRRLSQRLMRARDEDRRQMARELHESVGQTLAALKMALGNVREALPAEEGPAFDAWNSAYQIAEEAIREVRTISYLMHPPLLDEAGFAVALEWYVKGFAARSGIKVDFQIPDAMERLPQEIETAVFRIVQEALTNVHRYSGSATAAVIVARDNPHLSVEIHDAGCGILPPSSSRTSQLPAGVGIAAMRERVQNLNGTFEISTTPGHGTTVRALLPLNHSPGRPHHG
jgi:PAS domain S-box-containing protein